jgi:hypothetical protein
MNDKIVSSVSKVLWDTDLVASRVTLALSEFFWAIMLFWPGDTFDRPTYAHMSTVMSEEAWGLLFLISSITQITIVLTENFYSMFAKIFAGWNASIWGYTVLSMLLSVYPPPAAVGGEIALALAALWVWARPYILASGYRHVRHLQ